MSVNRRFTGTFSAVLMAVSVVGATLVGMAMCATQAHAAEVDAFTLRHSTVADSTQFLNQVVNRRLLDSIELSNKQARRLAIRRHPKTRRKVFPQREGLTYCNNRYLVEAIKSSLAGPIVGELESWIEKSAEVSKIAVPFKDSIYRDFKVEEAPMLAASERISSLVLVNGVLVGSDKFGHFFTEGRTYFDKLEKESLTLEQLLVYGEKTEIVLFGSLTTGVFSFADLVANVNGLRFWSALRAEYPNPLSGVSGVSDRDGEHTESGKKEAPYIICDGEQWRLVRSFNWRNYVDAAWDEGVNCNLFRTADLLTKVQLNMDSACPAEPVAETVQHALREKYGDLYGRLVNIEGHTVLPKEWQAYTLVEEYLGTDEGKKRSVWVIRAIRAVIDKLKTYSGYTRW